jgi:DNA-binding winged helix-turn-helix (wHTH) protein/TolB-like protein
MPQPRSSLRFGPFVFVPASGELWHDGRRVRLQRQPSRLLELLLATPGDVVGRDEIRRALWGDDTHVDFERSLNFCVAKLRSALRDSAQESRYIETVPTRGYRFIAPVLLDALPDAPAVPALAPAGAAGSPAFPSGRAAVRRRWLVAAVAAALVAAVAVASWSWRSPASNDAPKVVVVPFHNETGVADLDRVAKGVSDATVARLAAPERLTQLRVIGNAANLRLSFRPRDMKAMGDSLGAQYLVLGQMKRDDRRMRIVAHLIRVSDQTHVWAKTYDTDALDLPQQESIGEAIAAAVTVNLGKG